VRRHVSELAAGTLIVAAAMAAIALVRIVFRPPPFGDSLKWLQVSEELFTVILIELFAGPVVGSLHTMAAADEPSAEAADTEAERRAASGEEPAEGEP